MHLIRLLRTKRERSKSNNKITLKNISNSTIYTNSDNCGGNKQPKKITKYSGNGVNMDSEGNVTSCSENFQAEIEEY